VGYILSPLAGLMSKYQPYSLRLKWLESFALLL
jgi:hypothetical protein